ncbi:MAG: EAL domain-containing protein [Oscillospiraceae bacterium]|nr:EAL domain-containing protein [Oscillospiraceae bacterium]
MEKEVGKFKKRKKTQKLSVKFTMTCILPASVLLIVLCFVSIWITKNSVVKNIENALIGQSNGKSQTLVENIEGTIRGVNFSQYADQIKELISNEKTDDVQKILSRIKTVSPMISGIEYVFLNDSKIYGIDYMRMYDSDPYWLEQDKLAEASPYYVMSNIVFDQQKPLITYVYPFSISDGDKADSCLVMSVDNRTVLRTLEISISVEGQKWMLASSDNEIIYHSIGYNETAFKNIEKALGIYDKENTILNNVNGNNLVVSVHRIGELDNLTLIYVTPVNNILRQAMTTFILVIIFTVISIIIISFFILLMTKKLVNEINAIRKSLKGLSTREYSENLEIQTQDEIGELVEDFNTAINELRYQAEHDSKTGFYNSKAFMTKASAMLENGEMETYAIVRVDIDNFSFINDIYDWEVGDQILVKIANILNAVFDENATHGYLGNDIFVVMMGYNEQDDMLTRIIKANENIKNCDERIHLVPHFGIADKLEQGCDMSVMCDYAGIALKTIKGNLLETYVFYDRKFDEKHNIQKFVESKKQKALENNEFFILLQPKCNINTGQVVGAEALVRWKEPDTDQIISPGKFIPIFEKNGFIVTLDKYVWEETCKVIKKWRDMGYRDIPVSVNVSRMHIFNPGFAKGLTELVHKYGIPPELLEVEITESALIGDDEGELERVMEDLRNRGFKLLMDDFASGYSSLIALQKLPFDVIKIDKALIDNIDDPKNRKFVSGTVSFLIDLEKEIVVEGVEYDWQKEILKDTGSEVVQGYCFSKPISVEDFEKMAFEKDSDEKQ